MPKELKKIDVKQGTGAEAVAGKTVVVHYTGWLYDPSKPDGQAPSSTARAIAASRLVPVSAADA